MPTLTHFQLKEQELKVLSKPSQESCKSPTLKSILKGGKRTIPKKDKAILVQAVFQKNAVIGRTSFLSPNTVPGSKVALISETIRGKSWSNAVGVWLQVDAFLKLARAVAIDCDRDKILAFMIVLHNYSNDLDMLKTAYRACEKVASGTRLLAHFGRKFSFEVFGPDELYTMRDLIHSNAAMFNKVRLQVDKDLLAVIHVNVCSPFKEIQGWKMDPEMEILPVHEVGEEDKKD